MIILIIKIYKSLNPCFFLLNFFFKIFLLNSNFFFFFDSLVLVPYLTMPMFGSFFFNFISHFFPPPFKSFFFFFTIGSEQDIKKRNLKGNFKCAFRRGSRHLPKASLWSTEAAETASSITNTISIFFPRLFFTCTQKKKKKENNKKMH